MAGKKPPNYSQLRYRGKIRADMQSCLNHIDYLNAWNQRYNGKPLNYYPNQLATQDDIDTMLNCGILLVKWLRSMGPIPSRIATTTQTEPTGTTLERYRKWRKMLVDRETLAGASAP